MCTYAMRMGTMAEDGIVRVLLFIRRKCRWHAVTNFLVNKNNTSFSTPFDAWNVKCYRAETFSRNVIYKDEKSLLILNDLISDEHSKHHVRFVFLSACEIKLLSFVTGVNCIWNHRLNKRSLGGASSCHVRRLAVCCVYMRYSCFFYMFRLYKAIVR
jgi:hypothetical protein